METGIQLYLAYLKAVDGSAAELASFEDWEKWMDEHNNVEIREAKQEARKIYENS